MSVGGKAPAKCRCQTARRAQAHALAKADELSGLFSTEFVQGVAKASSLREEVRRLRRRSFAFGETFCNPPGSAHRPEYSTENFSSNFAMPAKVRCLSNYKTSPAIRLCEPCCRAKQKGRSSDRPNYLTQLQNYFEALSFKTSADFFLAALFL